MLDQDEDGFDTLLERADAVLYLAQNDGRNRVRATFGANQTS